MLRNKLYLCLAVAAALAAGPLGAQPHGQTVDVELSNFKYSPASIQLQHGQAYALHFVNRSSGGHDFMAPDFFAAASVAPEDKGKVKGGRVALAGGEEAIIHLTAPAAGHYKVHCSHFMHTTFGMTGEIVVG